MPSGETILAGGGQTQGARRSDIALMGIYEISKLLSTPARLENTLAGVLQLLSSFLDMRHGLIALLNDRGSPDVVVGSAWREETAKRYFERLPEQAIGRIMVTKMPLVIERMKDDSLFENWDFSEWGAKEGDWSFIGVPIKDRGEVVGTLTIDREHAGSPYFSFDEDVRFLSMVANLVGQTVRLQTLIARDRERLMGERRLLEKAVEHAVPPAAAHVSAGKIIGTTPAIQAVLEKVRRVARSHSPVLLRGESGTGKEMFAEALHALSPRREGPFVAVNCAALAESVLESELFGHEKGSFTGAISQRKGRFELADKGTLFLDEIGEISPAFQAKLLRVLQLGEFERVGGGSTIKVDVRIVAATNRNLEDMVAEGSFRADLYYRVSVVPIFLPPLRERRGDIPLLAHEFVERFNQEHGTRLYLSPDALGVLGSCWFPGNVRELENCVRRTATLAKEDRIVAGDFACRHDECLSAILWRKSGAKTDRVPPPLDPAAAPDGGPASRSGIAGLRGSAASAGRPGLSAQHPPEKGAIEWGRNPDGETQLADGDSEGVDIIVDRERLLEAMEKAGWVQAKAARILGLTPRQIGYALRKHRIDVRKF